MEGHRPGKPKLVRFGIFEVDLRTGELRRNGAKVKLQEQPFQLLVMLLEHPGQIVTREELQCRLWPHDTFVDFEHSINAAVKRLREGLDDMADSPRFVATVPRHGYRFIAPVDSVMLDDHRRPQDTVRRAALQRRIALITGITAGLLGVLFALNVAGLRHRVLRAGRAVHESPLQIRSIAVLPLENLSHDPEQEYFADGMTDELITNLGKINALRVISRTTAMHFKGTPKTLPEIARELDVDAVVEGTVQRSAKRVRITANLIDARTDRHLWANTYESEMQDVLILQGKVAQAIAHGIQMQLTSQEQTHLTTTQSINPEVYEAYLKGRYFWNRRTEGAIEKGLDYFQQAIRKDPDFARAYAGLADSYCILGTYEYLPPKDAYPRAKAAAQRALEVDPTLAEAHASLGRIRTEHEWDFSAGEEEYRRAIQLNPNYAPAHQWYAELLMCVGRRDESLAEIERARRLDPLSLIINTSLADSLAYARRYDEAIRQFRQALEIDPNFVPAHFYLADTYAQMDRLPEAVAEAEKAVSLSGGATVFVAELAQVYAAAGNGKAARELLKEVSSRAYVPKYYVALAHIALGEDEQAFAWLQKAVEDRSPQLVWLKVDPNVNPLRPDPRFQDLLHRMNFPP